MLNKQQAEELIKKRLQEQSYYKKPGLELVIAEDATIEVEYGWIFFYQTKLYLETKSIIYEQIGCFPILVDKVYETLIEFVEIHIKNIDNLESCLKKYGKKRGQPLYTLPHDHELIAFLNCYLKITTIGGFPNEQSAIEYFVTYAKPATIEEILENGKSKLVKNSLIQAEITKYTHRDFKNEQEARQWLKKVIKILEDVYSKFH